MLFGTIAPDSLATNGVAHDSSCPAHPDSSRCPRRDMTMFTDKLGRVKCQRPAAQGRTPLPGSGSRARAKSELKTGSGTLAVQRSGLASHVLTSSEVFISARRIWCNLDARFATRPCSARMSGTEGTYRCVGLGARALQSRSKRESGRKWPSGRHDIWQHRRIKHDMGWLKIELASPCGSLLTWASGRRACYPTQCLSSIESLSTKKSVTFHLTLDVVEHEP